MELYERRFIRKEYTTSTVCVYFSHRDNYGNTCGYSLFGIDISMPTSANEEGGGWEIKSLPLLVQLAAPGREYLVCAKLGSKFYFLGGTTPHPLVDGLYECPADVRVYDPTDPHNSAKDPLHRATEVAPMNSGKMYLTTFEANGKLYVLGGRQPCLISADENDEYCVFEEYNPVKNQWKKLAGPSVIPENPNPSGRSYGHGWSASHVMGPRTVLIIGSFAGYVFTFNPVDYRWSKIIRRNLGCYPLGRYPLYVEDYLYRVYPGHEVSKLGPFSSLDDPQPFHALKSLDADVEWGSSERNLPFVSDTSICHLAHRYFCILETVTSSSPRFAGEDDPFPRQLKEPGLRTCGLNVIIHQELPGDQACFKLKFLHQALFEFTTNRSKVEFISCHVMNAEGVGDKNIGTYLEGKNERIHVDFRNIDTSLNYNKIKWNDKDIGTDVNSQEDYGTFWRKMRLVAFWKRKMYANEFVGGILGSC